MSGASYLLCRWDSKAEPAPLIDMICLFPALEELEIRQGFEVSVSSPPATAVLPRPLRRLELVTTPFKTIRPFFAWLDAFGHLPNVDVVRLPRLKSEHDVLGARQILQQLGGAPQYLDIALQHTTVVRTSSSLLPKLTRHTVNACTAFDLSLHPNLKELVIRDLSLRRFDFDRNRILLWLTSLAAPAFERLVLVGIDLMALNQSFNWAAVDAFLCSERFPRLQGVLFHYQHTGHHCDNHAFLRETLPLLEAAGLLRKKWMLTYRDTAALSKCSILGIEFALTSVLGS
ncbi:hypothetical protein DFH08DRAFT_995652 [Mycena albidolilacea]|uniref:Uncharacterized protein n=1 Tax=Mycena albidolilacea TaxID=1033008 RepID=A0AAD7A6V8_9AGAR|nr:hypothetical protein DFH08DRAFT_995652 [Mycena albidolilacea]